VAEPALMRFQATPVFKYSDETGPVLGVVLTGGITNGKTPITYIGVNALESGYFGLYTKDRYGKPR
jgi:hypothetical protein